MRRGARVHRRMPFAADDAWMRVRTRVDVAGPGGASKLHPADGRDDNDSTRPRR